MPIKGLTNRRPQFPQIGQLRKGIYDKEEERAIDLDYFRFTSDIPEVIEAFVSAYGEQPRLINVRLPYQTTDENWEAWYEEYLASGMIHRCDGEYVVRYRDEKTGRYVSPEYGTMKCPYHSGEKERTKKRPGCYQAGRLQVIIPELRRLAYVMVITSSKNDIMHLDGQIRGLESLNGDLRGIPMQLRRRPEKISTPKVEQRGGKWVQTAQRVRRESWLLSIEAAPSYVDLQIEAQERAALPEWATVAEEEVVEAEIVEVPEEEAVEVLEEKPDKPPEPEILEPANMLTLGEALGTPLVASAPKLGLEKGSYLLAAVKMDARDLVEYLTKASSYQHQTQDNLRLQDAAITVLENWDEAREVVLKGGEETEEVETEGEEQIPLM